MNQNSSIQPRKGDMNVAPKFFLPYQAKWIKDNSKL